MFGWVRCGVEELQYEDGPDGRIERWATREHRWCRVAPVSAEAQVAYQQLASVVTHRVTFRGQVALPLGSVRLVVGGKTYTPSRPALTSGDGRWTVVEVQEVQG